jgi:hypothetical protein
MSYLTPYYPHGIKAFLETRPALAVLADTLAIYLLALAATGLLIFWSVKFYRPKPIQPKEPKLGLSDFVGGWGFKVFRFIYFTYAILGGLVFVFILIAVPVYILHGLFTGQAGLEYLILLGYVLLSSFAFWLIIR